MNYNQRIIYNYRKECFASFENIVYLIDRLFENDLSFVGNAHNRIFYNTDAKWASQIERNYVPLYVEKYCNVSYYGMLSEKVRMYKIKKRLELD